MSPLDISLQNLYDAECGDPQNGYPRTNIEGGGDQYLEERDSPCAQYVSSFAVRTRAGKLNGMSKRNQDGNSCISDCDYSNESYFFGVYDGHGEVGHTVSSFISRNMYGLFQEQAEQ